MIATLVMPLDEDVTAHFPASPHRFGVEAK